MALAGILRILVQGDTAQLQSDLANATRIAHKAGQDLRTAFDSATGALGKFAGGLTNLPTLILGAGLGLAMQQVLQFADALDESAERIGLTTDAFQALSAQAREAGATAQQFERGLASLNTQIGTAAEGGAKAQENFRKIGVAWLDTAGKTRTTEAVFRDVMSRLGEIPNAADRAAASVELFGAKAGPALVAAFRGGAAAMDDFEARARQMGLILDRETIQNLSRLQDQLDQIGLRFQVVAANMMATLGPTFGAILDLINNTITGWQTLLAYMGLTQDTAESIWNKVADIDAKLNLIPAGMEKRRKELEAQRDALIAQARAMERQKQIEAELGKTQRLGAPAGAIAPPAITAATSAAAGWEAAAKAQQRIQDEANAATEKYIRDEEKMREELSAARIQTAGQAAKAEMAFAEEVNAVVTKYIEDEEAKRQAASNARVEQAFTAAQTELRLREETNELTRRFQEQEAARVEADWTKRTEPIRLAFQSVERAISTSITGIIEGSQTAAQAFEKMGESIVLSLTESVIKRGIQAIEQALDDLLRSQAFQQLLSTGLGALGGAFGGGTTTVAPVQTFNIGTYGAALAGGGIVQAPTISLIGERGPEAVVPLDRWGEMGGGGVTVNIIDQRKSGAIEQRESRNANGEPQIDVMILDVVKSGIAGGALDQSMASTYGVSRKGVAR